MYRRYAAEFVGTFGIVFAPVAMSASGHFRGGDTSLMAAAWVSGLSVLAMVYALGHISAAHFNPAVTVGFAVAGRFPWKYTLPYFGSQFSGSIAAAVLADMIFGGGFGVHVPGFVSAWKAIGIEAALTFFLMLVIIAVATDTRAHGAVAGLAIGFTVVFDVLIGGPLTGGSMNPARSFGPALFGGASALSHLWIYFVGPLIGSVTAVLIYEFLRGGERFAQGAPSDISDALAAIRAES